MTVDTFDADTHAERIVKLYAGDALLAYHAACTSAELSLRNLNEDAARCHEQTASAIKTKYPQHFRD